jgi:hypothetical protein
MMRFFSAVAFCLVLVACSSNNDSDSGDQPGDELNPTSMTLEFVTPPTNGKLPPDLMPPI